MIGAFPVLSGGDLARLKESGVSDEVLVFMIEHPRETAPEPPPAPAAAEPDVAYVTRGIRAAGEPLENQTDGDNPGAVCKISEGQICEVTAHFEGRKPTPLGGLPEYSVSYEVMIED